MKRALFLVILSLSSLIAKADAWDNMTKEEVDNVYAFLQKYPFVFDYCDCCGDEVPSSLIKIESMNIVSCDWKPEDFSIEYTGISIGYKGIKEENGENSNSGDPSNYEISGKIYMNYTWGFNIALGKVTPLFDIIPYNMYGDDNKPCEKIFDFPSAKLVGNKSYKKFLKKINA